MRDFFRKKTWIITAVMIVLSCGLSLAIVYFEFSSKEEVKVSQASSTDNVSGWAWNSNIGWISFNCTNESPACSGTNYGVKIDLTTGHFSGYAWSSSVGWISFNETGAPDYGFNSSCPSAGSCAAAGNCTACYNWNDHKVYGWAKILTMGDNGWIKFNDTWPNGVSINQTTGNFSGWAWNANDNGFGIGWLSFNCSNDSPACGSSNYKVAADVNQSPSATALTAPNWNYVQASANALHANLQFSLVDPDSGSYGSAYQVIVKKADDTTVLDTGKCTGYNIPSANCKIDNTICMKNGSTGCINSGDCVCQYQLDAELAYGTGYKWSVKVWDNYDVASALTPYDTNPDTDNDDGVVLTFTTYKHKFPKVSATYFPTKPSRGEKVKFTDTSKTYKSAAPTTEVPCDASICSWLWTIPSGATIDDAASSTPTIIFNTAGSNNVFLKVTDLVDSYYTQITIPVGVNAQLPKWKEVKPE